MNTKALRVKEFLLRKVLIMIGLVFGFGSISFLTMCAKYGDIAEVPGRINGKVTSSSTGVAIENIKISIKESAVSVKTNVTGNYSFNLVFPAQYTIEAKDIDSTENGEFKPLSKTIQLNPNEVQSCDFVLIPK
jgi:hypothetical protein